MLAGRECWSHLVQLPIEAELSSLAVQEMVVCQMETSCGRVSAGAGHGLFGTALADEMTFSPQKDVHPANWKQACAYKAQSPSAPVVSS